MTTQTELISQPQQSRWAIYYTPSNLIAQMTRTNLLAEKFRTWHQWWFSYKGPMWLDNELCLFDMTLIKRQIIARMEAK